MNQNKCAIHGKILLVDDDPEICALLSDTLRDEGHQVSAAYSGKEALEIIEQGEFDAVIADLEMKGMQGMDLVQRIKNLRPETVAIVITAFGTVESAVQAMKLGAYHYISKPFQLSEISVTLEKSLDERNMRLELSRLRREVETRFSFGNLTGKSKAMQEVIQLVRRVAMFSSTVLIVGESGTGKELVAKAIHYNSPRKEKPFVAINCGAIPENLLESKLFGYMKGSFTGAQSDHKGLFEVAEGGSLFLDEIGEMPMGLQVKLLRAVQEREIRPLGAGKNIPIELRLIAATNRDLQARVKQGAFREDLYYRLDVVTVKIPPLRERQEDIPLLAYHFLKKSAESTGKEVREISPEALRVILRYTWPGNVRELENVLDRAVILAEYRSILPSDLPEHLNMEALRFAQYPDGNEEKMVTLEEIERSYILRVLERTGGNKHLAAKILGIDRSTLYRKMVQYS